MKGKRAPDDDSLYGRFELPEMDDDVEAEALSVFRAGGYSFINIPPPLIGVQERALAKRIEDLVTSGHAPRNHAEQFYLAVLMDFVRVGKPPRLSALALVVGTNHALAEARGETIETHPRDLAKEIGCRYQTLLRVQRVAAKRAAEHLARKNGGPTTG